MLFKLYLESYFNYKAYIINNIAKLNLDTKSALILIKLLDLYLDKIYVINVEDLANYTNLHNNEVEEALVNLLQLNYYEFYIENDKNNIGTEQFSIEPFFTRLEAMLNNIDSQEDKEQEKLFSLLERKTKTILTNKDYEIISSYLEEGFQYDDFEAVIKSLEKTKYDITLKNITKYLEKNKEEVNPIYNDLFKQLGIK